MRKLYSLFFISVLLGISLIASSQNTSPARLKVFIDCSDTWCDMNFIRTEITLVDFLLDRQAADVYVLITEQETGGGGSQYQLIYFGQNQFRQAGDTIRFNTDPNATDFEERDLLIKYLKLGLTPYIIKTTSAKDVKIDLKRPGGEKNDSTKTVSITKDPWNYWVFRVGTHGYLSADEVYKSQQLSGNLSASRITDEWKVVFEAYGGRNKTTYTLEDDNGNEEKISVRNNNYEISHYLIKSINDHWSWGYEAGFSRSTFSNNKGRALFRGGVEYDIYPYKDVNTRFFTISYIADVRRNSYFDTTLYEKTKETLWGHSLKGKVTFNQKWGKIGLELEHHNYWHNWKYFNLSFSTEIDIRITGGLSFNISTYAELIRDQLYLPKGGATPQEVLTRRRQLASGYSIFTFFGINYRFGSKLNNFVNPRFD